MTDGGPASSPAALVVSGASGLDAPRPRVRLTDAITTLADFAIVSYAVDPAALARHLAPGFAPDLFPMADGTRRALVSAVSFRDVDFRFGFAPFLRFAFPQVNYRAYVTHAGVRGVWFFGTTIATRWVFVPRRLWKLPWHRARTSLAGEWAGERCTRYALASEGAWGGATAELSGTDAPTGRLDGFANEHETRLILTHPLVGWFRRLDGRLGSYSVWHAPLELRRGDARGTPRYDVFEQAGVIAPGQAPHSVLLQRETEFVIQLPPHALPG